MSRALSKLLASRTDIQAELRDCSVPSTVLILDITDSETGKLVTRCVEENCSHALSIMEQHKGKLVKRVSGSMMAVFPTSGEACQAAIAILNQIETKNGQSEAKLQVTACVALHHGLPCLRGADAFGDVIDVCATYIKRCAPPQILVSESVMLTAPPALARQFNTVQSQGKDSPESIYELRWNEPENYNTIRLSDQTVVEEYAATTSRLGRYLILTELGRGGMGTVYKAYDRLIGRTVAVKWIPIKADAAEYSALVERLKLEAHTAGMLDHPNIITVYDIGEEAGLFYFTMQCVEGNTAASLRDDRQLLTIPAILDYADQICSALSYAHSHGIVHRDIKPSNLMITPQGSIKVLDFGIAKLGDAGLTTSGMILGTPSYMAPEQAGAKRLDHRADIFAFGAVLYEMLTSELAFPGESTTAVIYKILNENPIPPRAIDRTVPVKLDAIVMKALEKEPDARFQSFDEFRRELRGVTVAATAETDCVEPALAPMNAAPPSPWNNLYPKIVTLARAHPRYSIFGAPALVLVLVLVPLLLGRTCSQPQLEVKALTPAAAVAKSPDFTLIVNGGNLSNSSKILWNGSPRPTTYVSDTQLKAAIPSSDLVAAGEVVVTVADRKRASPPALMFTINNPPTPADPAPSLPTPADPAPSPPSLERAKVVAEESKNAKSRIDKDKKRKQSDDETPEVSSKLSSDVPKLLSWAEQAMGRGDYAMARSYYQAVLSYDRNNAAAKRGLRDPHLQSRGKKGEQDAE